MRRSHVFSATGAFAAVFIVLAAAGTEAGIPLIDYVQRQPTYPGVAETGNINLSGNVKAALFSGSGASLTNLSATQLLTGTVPDARLGGNVALITKNNIFASSQRFKSHLNFLGQNCGIFFPTPTLNSATPMITMGGDDNPSYSRMVLGHSIAHPDWGLRYDGGGAFHITGPSGNAINLYHDGRLGVGGSSGASMVYVYPNAGLIGGSFYSNGAYALRSMGDFYVSGNAIVTTCLGIGTSDPALDIAIDDTDTGFSGYAGVLDAVVDGSSVASFRAAGLGIGRTPSVPLDVQGRAYFRNATGGVRNFLLANGQDCGELQTRDPNGLIKVWLSSYQSGGNYGSVLAACDSAGISQAWIDCKADTGKGTLVADIKNFRETNPRDPKTDIYYASLEGPEAAMYIRGNGRLVNGRAQINLPDHFRDLANMEMATLQLTPASFRSLGLGYEVDENGQITVGELGGGHGSYAFSWVVTAVRKGYEDYEVVRPWTDAPHSGTEQEAWAARMKSIQAKVKGQSHQNAPPLK